MWGLIKQSDSGKSTKNILVVLSLIIRFEAVKSRKGRTFIFKLHLENATGLFISLVSKSLPNRGMLIEKESVLFPIKILWNSDNAIADNSIISFKYLSFKGSDWDNKILRFFP